MTGPLGSLARVDTLLSPVLLGVRDCLCEQLRSSVAGPVCQCYVVHNQALPTMDGCDCTCTERELDVRHAGRGEATVRAVRLEPDLAVVGAGGPGPCPPGWQAVFSMVTYRCVPVAEGDEVLPGEVRTDSALELNADLTAMLAVVACCPELAERNRSVDWAGPVGPLGGCGGWEVQFRVALSGGPGGCG